MTTPRTLPIAVPSARALRRPIGLALLGGGLLGRRLLCRRLLGCRLLGRRLLRWGALLLRLVPGCPQRGPQVVEDEPRCRLGRRRRRDRLVVLENDEDAALRGCDFELGELRALLPAYHLGLLDEQPRGRREPISGLGSERG